VRSWKEEAVAVGGEGERHVEHLGVLEALLHPVADLWLLSFASMMASGRLGL
jgi:hypothetical protein